MNGKMTKKLKIHHFHRCSHFIKIFISQEINHVDKNNSAIFTHHIFGLYKILARNISEDQLVQKC
jgi:hypothetical protein